MKCDDEIISFNYDCLIIPPESNKRYDEGVFKRIWKQAGQALHRAETVVVIGYSFPPTDSHANALFRSTKREARFEDQQDAALGRQSDPLSVVTTNCGVDRTRPC